MMATPIAGGSVLESLEVDPTRWAMFWDHPHAVALLDPQGRIVCNNPMFRRLLEGIPEAVCGTSFLDLLPRSETDRVAGYLTRTLRRETQPDFATCIRRGGERIDIVVTVVPAQACGQEGLFVVLREVTGQLSAERAIARIEREKGHLARLHAAILDSVPIQIALLDASGHIIAVNEAWRRFRRQNRLTHAPACVGQNYLTVCNEAAASSSEAAQVAEGLAAVLKGARREFEKDYSCHSGSERRWFRLHTCAVDSIFVERAVVMHMDLTENKLAAERSRLTANALRQLSEGVLVTDGSLRTASINDAFATMLGYPAERTAGIPLEDYLAAPYRGLYVQRIRASLDRKRRWRGKLVCRRGDGSEFPAFMTMRMVGGESINDDQVVAVIRDVSAEHDYERRLTHISNHDALTGLANRATLAEYTQRTIAASQGQQGVCALILVSLDRFKLLNESLGCLRGDRVLQEMAGLLRELAPPGELVGRLGNDEFALVLSGLPGYADAQAHAQGIFERVRLSVSQEGRLLSLTASVGISCYPLDGADFDELLRNANIAMREAKRAGGNTVRVYARQMSNNDLDRLTLQSELEAAIRHNELVLHYQPTIDLRTGDVTSIEALVRWQHRTLGLLAPGKFISLAEESGTITELGDWVLRTACADAVRLRQTGLAPGSVAVNLSARQFELPDLAKKVGLILEAAGLEPRSMRLELTETMVMTNPGDSCAILSELSAMGISLALDDFGTGYSSLGYLRQFPLNCLKIDRSFVSGLPGNERSEAITRAVVALGKALHMSVVAEGVENHAQLDFLRSLECDEVQGFLLGRPLPYDELVKWLSDRAAHRSGSKRRFERANSTKRGRRVVPWLCAD
jgi:diguanylate cyclase (GGDEF)-like protein/PAS domain S-box-containing protein